MKILWTEFAEWNLKDIYLYHKKIANKTIALKLKQQILNTTNQLKNHRYLVCQNYKIIYKEINEGILITDIFDTRLNPKKMNNPDLIR